LQRTRQRRQLVPGSILAMAFFNPSCASDITRRTPERPRLTRLRRNFSRNAPDPLNSSIETKYAAGSVIIRCNGSQFHDEVESLFQRLPQKISPEFVIGACSSLMLGILCLPGIAGYLLPLFSHYEVYPPLPGFIFPGKFTPLCKTIAFQQTL
jgi:hypothetical protein